jgi:hypothetical protein
MPWSRVVKVLPWPMSGAVTDRDASGVLEAAADVDEDVLAEGQVLAERAV